MKSERQRELEAIFVRLYEETEESVKDFRDFDKANINEDNLSLERRLLFMTNVESDLSYLYRQAARLKYQVEVGLHRAKALLEDEESEARLRPNFKSPFMSAEDGDAKARSLTIEARMDLREWEELNMAVRLLVDTIKSHQSDAGRERRDIDSRRQLHSLY